MSHADDGILNAFLDGELDDAASAELERHLQGCPPCAARLDEVARVQALATSLIAEAGATTAAAPAWSELLERAAGSMASPASAAELPRRRSLLLPGLAWAATLVLAFAIGWQARQAELLQPEIVEPEAVQREAPPPVADVPAAVEVTTAPAPAIADEVLVEAAPAPQAPTQERGSGEPFESIDPARATERLGAVPLLPAQAEIRTAAIGPGSALEGGRLDREVLQLRLAAPAGEATLLQQYEGAAWAAAAPAAAAPSPAGDADTAARRAPEMARMQAAESVAGASRLAQQAAERSVELLDAAFSVDADGTRRLRWRHPAGYLLMLESDTLDEAQLLALARSLR